MESFKKFPGDKLPDTCKFFIFLKEECISEKDYLHSIKLWNVFKISRMDDYHEGRPFVIG